jgi:hypothetical protein
MHKWVAEYHRGVLLFNVEEFRATSKAEAEHMAWQSYMHLADCLQITVHKLVDAEQNHTSLSERKREAGQQKKNGFRKVA